MTIQVHHHSSRPSPSWVPQLTRSWQERLWLELLSHLESLWMLLRPRPRYRGQRIEELSPRLRQDIGFLGETPTPPNWWDRFG
jgi:hypothetical protein